MANITTYNAKECIVTINGVNITGLGEDMITWEKEEAFFEPVVGAQGDVVKSEINNSLYTLTIAVQPTTGTFNQPSEPKRGVPCVGN